LQEEAMRRGILIAVVTLYASVALGQGVGMNSGLCSASIVTGRETLASGSAAELSMYLGGLERAAYTFSRQISPQQAATQLGLGIRFRVTYGLLLEEAKKRAAAHNDNVGTDEIIEYLRSIIKDETAIENSPANDSKYTSAILYLRALQSGVCAFPYALKKDVPAASLAINELAKAYPDMNLAINEVFQDVYDRTLAYSANELRDGGVVSIYRIVDQWRQETLKWRAGGVSPQPFDAKAFAVAQKAGRSILVAVYGSDCPICETQKVMLRKVLAEPGHGNFVYFVVDFDSQKDAVKLFGPESTLISFKGSREGARTDGASRFEPLFLLVGMGL
jgi:thioredoxin